MTRLQKAIIAILGTGVVGVFSLLGALVFNTIPNISPPPLPTPTRAVIQRQPTLPSVTIAPLPTRGIVRIGNEFGKDWGCRSSYQVSEFYGTVHNETGLTVRFVRGRATLYDSNQNIINTNVGYVDSDRIHPGASATFKIFVSDPLDRRNRICHVKVEDWRE